MKTHLPVPLTGTILKEAEPTRYNMLVPGVFSDGAAETAASELAPERPMQKIFNRNSYVNS